MPLNVTGAGATNTPTPTVITGAAATPHVYSTTQRDKDPSLGSTISSVGSSLSFLNPGLGAAANLLGGIVDMAQKFFKAIGC